MFFLATVFLFGFASAQKVTELTFCSIDEQHLRMDCKYELPAESTGVVCKYTEGDKIIDTTDKEEVQHASYKGRAKVQILKDNICRLRLDNVPSGKSNFTCNVKQTTDTARQTSVIEKKLLLPCSAWSGLLQSCTGLLLTFMTFPMLLEMNSL